MSIIWVPTPKLTLILSVLAGTNDPDSDVINHVCVLLKVNFYQKAQI
jgi:hypothetical protein